MEREKQNTQDLEHSFTAELKIARVNLYVDLPEHVVNALGGTKVAVLINVAGSDPSNNDAPITQKATKLSKDADRLRAISRLASSGWFRSTLVPSRSGATRLYLDQWMRETAGVGAGDRVHVTLKPDHGSRELTIPDALQEALNSNAEAKAAWEALTPSRQHEILIYLNFLKTPAALERNIQKVIAASL